MAAKMVINLKGYLKQLEGTELRRPEYKRKNVPTLKELAAAIGIHEMTMVNIANGKIKLLNLNTAQRIISEMRKRGFDMQTTDLLDYQALPSSEVT